MVAVSALVAVRLLMEVLGGLSVLIALWSDGLLVPPNGWAEGRANIYIRHGRGPEVATVECIAVCSESLRAALCRGILVT